ncbi:MAG: tRNA (adenosine(37)-N6)-threonylcarbamoyltransferase complex transferase subunit TsaD [Solirubrobacterales bacterium]
MAGPPLTVLALETSCDDTCAAVVQGGQVRSNVISSQDELHDPFGGVVPEVASRRHLQLVNAVVARALADAGTTLADCDAIAVTRGPGLIGALLIGVSTAKALAASVRAPLICVDHLHGHVAANLLEPHAIDPPFLCLIVSGGHTLLAGVHGPGGWDAGRGGCEVLGSTRDDAAGEAFDKGARLLGLGYPGGVAIDRRAADGDPGAFDFPLAMRDHPSLDFSFSGLKTALVYRVRDLGDTVEDHLADLCASYQRAIVDALLAKLGQALDAHPWPAVALGGGVAANSELRRRAGELCERRGVPLTLPPAALCTDNAAMIGSAARFCEPIAYPAYLDLDAFADRRAA